VHGQVERLCDVKKNFRGEVFCVFHEQSLFMLHGAAEEILPMKLCKNAQSPGWF